MGLFELKLTMPAQPATSGPNLNPLTDATKAVAKATEGATAHADARHTDLRQISAEERYGLINIWQEAFHALGVWSVEEIQRKGIKLNDGQFNYILLDRWFPSRREYDQSLKVYANKEAYTEHYLAHVSTSDPFLKEAMMQRHDCLIHGSDLLELISISRFKKERMPQMLLGWMEKA